MGPHVFARSRLGLFAPVLAVLAFTACGEPAPPTPSAACEPRWSAEPAAEFVDLLTRATETELRAWEGYDLGDAAYVLHAGASEAGRACLGVWRGGQAVAFAALPDPPTLATPLYGYHLPAEGDAAARERFTAAGRQPESVRSWLEEAGVDRATIMPVTFEDFPMELPTLVKVQVALHEGFHVQVQSPHWSGAATDWPAWDRQPDREGLAACYGATDDAAAAFAEERERLVATVESLLDGDVAAACEAGEAFLARRAARHRMLEDVRVARHDGTPGSCREAEAVMELEEGTADYASWAKLYELGHATREQLVRRYRAQQDDAFYLTGAMQLHATELMQPDRMAEATRRIANSTTSESGSITAAFETSLADYCG